MFAESWCLQDTFPQLYDVHRACILWIRVQDLQKMSDTLKFYFKLIPGTTGIPDLSIRKTMIRRGAGNGGERWQWTCYRCWIFCGSVEMVLENYKIWIKLDLSFPLFHFSRKFLPHDKGIQTSRYVVDPKFCHFVRPIPSVTILCPNMCFEKSFWTL